MLTEWIVVTIAFGMTTRFGVCVVRPFSECKVEFGARRKSILFSFALKYSIGVFEWKSVFVI